MGRERGVLEYLAVAAHDSDPGRNPFEDGLKNHARHSNTLYSRPSCFTRSKFDIFGMMWIAARPGLQGIAYPRDGARATLRRRLRSSSGIRPRAFTCRHSL